jgi:uncharacterized protein YbjT (DUF2867 family)
MKALVIGATGATGKDLVKSLLKDSSYTEVVIFVRKPSGIKDPKLTELVIDFYQLQDIDQHIRGDVLFSCIGTTLKIAGSKDKQWFIDSEIPLAFARIAKKNGVAKMGLLSAYGASAGSRIFYSKMKGQLEDAIGKLGFEQYIIFRPGLLVRKDTDRLGERVMVPMLQFLNSLGLFRKFRPIDTAVLAEKMVVAPKIFPAGKHVIELEKIFSI